MSASGGDLKARLQEAIKGAMRARERNLLGVLRLVSAAIKQREVDERIDLADDGVIAVLGKMLKQRKDSLSQFEEAGRADLAAQEAYEITVIESFLPTALSAEAIAGHLDDAFAELAPQSIKDMGRVMAALETRLQGRADLGEVSRLVRNRLVGG